MTLTSRLATYPLRGAERRSGYSADHPTPPKYSLSAGDVKHGVIAVLTGVLLLSGWSQSVAIGVMGVSVLGLVVLGAIVTYLRVHRLRAPDPEVTTLEGEPATLIRRERVAFLLGVLVLWDVILVCAVWAGLAARESMGLALILGWPVLWAAWFTVLVVVGRFDAGGIWFTPGKLVYKSRGLRLEVPWDEIRAADGGSVPGMVLLLTARPGAFTARNVPLPWRSERVASSTLAVVRTDDMDIDPGTLVRLIGRYAASSAHRAEIGTAQSLASLEMLRPSPAVHGLPETITIATALRSTDVQAITDMRGSGRTRRRDRGAERRRQRRRRTPEHPGT